MKKIKILLLLYILLSAILMIITGLSGYMTHTVKAIGHRSERFDKYQSFTITGNKLIVQYTIDIEARDTTPCSRSFYIDHTIAEGVKRWGEIALDSGWGKPEIIGGVDWWRVFRVSLFPSEGQLPEFEYSNYIQIEPSEEKWYINAEKIMRQQIRECLGDSAYCINFPGGYASSQFVIIKREELSENVKYKHVSVRTNDYYENWSKYVHYVLLPFAFILDVIAFPLTVLSNFCL